MRDLKYAIRKLARSPGFTLIAGMTLALGIAASTTIFSLVDAALLRQLPYAGSGPAGSARVPVADVAV